MGKLSFNSTIMLRNGVKMPRLGYGSAEIAPTVTEQTKIIRDAIDVGYRLIDTANIYHTERAVGKAIKESGISRDDFVSTGAKFGILTHGRAGKRSLRILKRACADWIWNMLTCCLSTGRFKDNCWKPGK